MSQQVRFLILCFSLLVFFSGCNEAVPTDDVAEVEQIPGGEWIRVSRQQIIEASNSVLAMPDIALEAEETIIRIRALEMDWDIGAMVYQPEDTSKIPTGSDGKKVGVFMLHGGSGDHRSKDTFARFLTGKFGFKVVSMSYPGRLYLQDPSRDWPGDTIKPDGTARTPIWLQDELISPDQYTIVEDKEESRRARWGTLILACAKEGTNFYNRLAGWPVAFEEGGKDLLARYLPEEEYSIYAHGHSTGGPFALMLSQRVPNIEGIIGMESSPFGAIYGQMLRQSQGLSEPWTSPFNCLRIRSWRDTARYAGYEAIEEEGTQALSRLAMLMEEVFERWERGTRSPQFKAENIIHFDSPEGLTGAARATAQRLKLSDQETNLLVDRYLGYLRELRGEDVKPVPPLILAITKNSRDHTPESYRDIYVPMFAAMNPAPKVRVIQLDAGIHGYSSPEPDLPKGVAPMGVKIWYDAIMDGYYTGS